MAMSQSPMVCNKQNNGCGYVAFLYEFKSKENAGRTCPMCGQDQAIELTSRGMSFAVDDVYLAKARMLLDLSMGL
jgi:hypothetical protein